MASPVGGALAGPFWAIDQMWCMTASARVMADAENIAPQRAFERTAAGQMQLVSSLVHGRPYPMELFRTFRPFSGVFPVDPWKPHLRESAQRAMFLCQANVTVHTVAKITDTGLTAV